MDHTNPRPQKRARFEDSPQCDLPARGFLDELPYIGQPQLAQATTFYGHAQQVWAPFPVASLLEQSTTSFNTALTSISNQWLMPATQLMSNGIQNPDSVLYKKFGPDQGWYHQPIQSSSELGASNLSFEPWQDFGSSLTPGQFSQQIIPLPNDTSQGSASYYNHIDLPMPTHAINDHDLAEITPVNFAQDSGQLAQSVTSKATTQTVCFGMVNKNPHKLYHGLNIIG
ncbi:hypothetical protein GGR58DRAFT_15365 [Xylaria digitata]|nr:hypothetical protein GGR58DRAFT_15365 [Xylaria digitata]